MSMPKKHVQSTTFGLSDSDKLNDATFFPPKPATLTPSFSSPDLSAFRLKNSFGDFMDPAEAQQRLMSQTGASVLGGHNSADIDAAAISGSFGICRYFLQGFCSRGDRCNFAHIMNINSIGANGVGGASRPHPQQSLLQQQQQHQLSSGLPHQTGGFGAYGMSAGSSPSALSVQANQAALAAFYDQASMLYPGNLYAQQAMQFNNMSNINALKFHAALQKQKKHSQEEASRFANIPLKDLVGQIAALSRDQHGCRYLQRKLEEQDEQSLGMIFTEVYPVFVELMIDPFGNYLCQKLLEHCTQDQRSMLIEHVAPDLMGISLNMHGTRAVQKLIEHLSTPSQINTVINALDVNVVVLIKDLNGNHVIQKCLNRLSKESNQFIYNAVSRNCIEVATHRHGCCVLQRCIDHASDTQRAQLVSEIIYHALTLVQDPFGNYVVQYVLDLTESRFSELIIRRFLGNICLLSVQKFSSNVIEKCIRVASADTRALLIDELLSKERLDKLLRDSYANYVVQTALDYADSPQRIVLVECIRPILPSIRNTPYGKRIQTKIMRDSFPPSMNTHHHLGPVSGNSTAINAMASHASVG
eukprot:jgi/Hompol1/6711/HPOL_001642-RA